MPDPDVWPMLERAKTSTMTREEVIERLALSLRRNAGYLAHRERRKRHTAYDEVLEADMEAIARAIVLLQESP